jgi:hypothetical protein
MLESLHKHNYVDLPYIQHQKKGIGPWFENPDTVHPICTEEQNKPIVLFFLLRICYIGGVIDGEWLTKNKDKKCSIIRTIPTISNS